MRYKRFPAVIATSVAFFATGPGHAATVLSDMPTIFRGTPYLENSTYSVLPSNLRATPYPVTSTFSVLPSNLRATPYRVTSTFNVPPVSLHATPYRVTSTLSDAHTATSVSGSSTLLSSVGFVSGSQIFSDAINVPTAGTLTVTLAGLSWLDALQNLNCFVSTPGGGILGPATNGTLDTVAVQPGTFYVNWYAQAGAPLHIGAYSLNVNFLPTTPPPTVPLPPTLPLLLAGLVGLGLGLRRPRLNHAPAA